LLLENFNTVTLDYYLGDSMSLVQLKITDFTTGPSGKFVLDRALKKNKRYRFQVPQLPFECIEEIVENLIEDHEALHSCILVDRLWCRISMPILWRFPQNFSINHQNFWSKIVKPILSCMNTTSLELIKAIGCKLVDSIQRPPLFDYVGYMQKLTCCDVHNIIEYILPELGRNENSILHNSLVERVYNLFLNGGSRLFYFEIPNIPICYHLCATSKLSNLQIFECDLDTSPMYFYEMAKYCNSIQQLLIFIDDCVQENFGLVTLIKSQRCLRYVRIRSVAWKSQMRVCLHELAKAIKGHSATLTYFEISGYICLPVSIIEAFENLKTLVISMDYHSTQELSVTSFPKLEELEIQYDEFTQFSTYMGIISKTRGTLKRIFWQFMDFAHDLDVDTYARTIIKSCPNLRFISLYIEKSSIGSLEKILRSCKLLEGIDIQTSVRSDSSLTTLALELLGKHAPKGLSMIVMDVFGCEILSEALEMFLDEWWGQKRKPLGLYINMEKPSQEILDIVEWYKFKGVFKEFCYRNTTPFYEIDSIRKVWRSDFPFELP
ncbi:6029_t:CDS:2, partial [Acaulospora morrowiae]